MEFNKAGLQGLVHQGPLRGHVLDGLSEGASLRSLWEERERERERERETELDSCFLLYIGALGLVS